MKMSLGLMIVVFSRKGRLTLIAQNPKIDRRKNLSQPYCDQQAKGQQKPDKEFIHASKVSDLKFAVKFFRRFISKKPILFMSY